MGTIIGIAAATFLGTSFVYGMTYIDSVMDRRSWRKICKRFGADPERYLYKEKSTFTSNFIAMIGVGIILNIILCFIT